MNPSAIKRQIIRELSNDIKLTPFQENRLNWEINSIRGDYEFGLKFTEYLKENQANIEAFINDLDSESKNEVKTVLKNIEFINTHTLIETVQEFISKKDKLIEQLNSSESIRSKYKLPIEIHEEAIFKYKHGLKFIPQNIIETLKNKDFLDCGAYMGDSALIFEREYNPSKIYAFEPVQDNYRCLLETIKLNNLEKIIPIDKGLGEKSCTFNFYPLGFCSYISEDGKAKMEVISIDEFVNETNPSVGLIKMDVEGFELEALKGAKNTIRNFKPVLLISIYHNPKEFFETKQYIQDLVPSYKFKIKHLADIRPVGETHLIAW